MKVQFRHVSFVPKIGFQNRLAFHCGAVTTWRLAPVCLYERQRQNSPACTQIWTPRSALAQNFIICTLFVVPLNFKELEKYSRNFTNGLYSRWHFLDGKTEMCLRLAAVEPGAHSRASPSHQLQIAVQFLKMLACNMISDLYKTARNFLFWFLPFFFFHSELRTVNCRGKERFGFLSSCFLNYLVKKKKKQILFPTWGRKKKEKMLNSF